MKVVYVGGPFRAPTHWQIEQNIRRAEELGLQVAQLGAMPLIPHTNARNYHGEGADPFWLRGTLELLRRCDAMILVPGWEKSSGTKAEIEEAAKLGLYVAQSLPMLAEWLGRFEDSARSLALFNGVESAPVAIGMQFISPTKKIFDVVEIAVDGSFWLKHEDNHFETAQRFRNYDELRDSGWRRYKDFR